MNEYNPLFDISEGFSVGEKPSTEGGRYTIKKTKGWDPENPKRIVVGWRKTLKPGVKTKHTGGVSKSKRSQVAKKSAKERKKHPAQQKKIIKKNAKLRKANKGN